MLQTSFEETMTAFNFPMVITDLSGKIIDNNPEFEELVNLDTNEDYLAFEDKLKPSYGNNCVLTVDGQDYIVIKKQHPSREDWKIYLIIEDAEFHHLLSKIKELDQVNLELSTIIENSYDGIYITDKEGVTLTVNSAIERITGIPKDFYIGKNVKTLMEKGILKESVTHKVLKDKKPVTLVQKANSGKAEIMLTGSPILNEEGEIEKIITNIRDISELNQLHKELQKARQLNEKYKKELDQLKFIKHSDYHIMFKNEKMHQIYETGERIANIDATILILGETGVGKDVLAKHIYHCSERSQHGDLIKVNCGAIPPGLLESELFGYEGGSFSGANRSGKAGMFELAHKGVIFLDEIGELSLNLQVKLLRVLQENEIRRVGGTKVKQVDVRVIAATNRVLKEMVKKGEFREDLYYRLNVLPIYIPPLRQRRDDILPFVSHFLGKYNKKYNVSKEFTKELKDFFYRYDWSGNVRELANLVERLILTVPITVVDIQDLPDDYMNKKEPDSEVAQNWSLKAIVEKAERDLLAKAVKRYDSTYKIAEALKTSQATIVRRLKKYNL